MNIHEQEFLIQQMKSRVTFGNCTDKKIWSPFSCCLRMKRSSNSDMDWFYITWNAWHAVKFCLPAITYTFKGVPFKFLHFLIILRWLDRKNGANVPECLHNVTSVTSNVTLHFSPLITGPNFGNSDSFGSLKGPSTECRQIQTTQFWSDFNEIVKFLIWTFL